MALYIDSAYLEDITAIARTVPIVGVTTNPTILLNAYERGQRMNIQEVLTRLLGSTNGTIFMQLSVVNEAYAYREALNYIETNPDRVIAKIPMTEIGIRVAQNLKKQGHRVAFTAVTTVSQAYIATMAGADFIIPYYNRMRKSGVDPRERLSQMAEVLSGQQQQTRIMAASIKSSTEATEALLAGADDLTVPPQILWEMVRDPETAQAVEKFEQDLAKLGKV